MKIILSRKGFDSANGGIPSPILPDGTLLTLPIPAKDENNKYSDLTYDKKTYFEIIKELNPKTKIKETYSCHLDPDITQNPSKKNKYWSPLFGQVNAAQSHLMDQNVTIGDLFLFFGWFKQTEIIRNKFQYIKASADLHLIFGYLQVGQIFTDIKYLPNGLKYHPHAQQRFENATNNCIYKANEKLSFLPTIMGASGLKFHKNLILTKPGYSRGRWNLPKIFNNEIKITYHNSESFKENYFQSANIGQEFVISANDGITNWAKNIIMKGN